MATIIYLNNDEAIIVKGSKRPRGLCIESIEHIPLQEGSIINGIILEKENIIKALKPFKNQLKGANLILDSSNITIKKIEIPKAAKKNINNIMKHEMTILEAQEELVIGHSIKETDNMLSVLGAAAPKSLVESYIELFKAIEVRLSAVNVATEAFVELVTSQKPNSGSRVFNIISGRNMTSIILQGSSYSFANRSRLLEIPNTSQRTTEIYSKLSTMIQFNKSQKSQNKLETSMYIGLQEEEIASLQKYATEVNSESEIIAFIPKLDKIMGNKEIAKAIYPIAGLCISKNNIDLLKAYNNSKKGQKTKTVAKTGTLIVIVSALLIGSTYTGIRIATNKITKEAQAVQNYLTNSQDANLINNLNELQNQTIDNRNAYNEIEGVIQSPDIKIFSDITLANLIEISQVVPDSRITQITYENQTQIAIIKGDTQLALGASRIANSLSQLDQISVIDYQGYSSMELGYTFEITAKIVGE